MEQNGHLEETYSLKASKISDLTGLLFSGKGDSIFFKKSIKSEKETRSSYRRYKLLLLHCCFTSTVNIKGHVGTVS